MSSRSGLSRCSQTAKSRIISFPFGGSCRILTILFVALAIMAGSQGTYARKSHDPWQASQVIKPAVLAKLLSASGAQKLLILHVGFPLFYRNGHVPGSITVGPTSKPEGIQALEKTLQHLPHDRRIILYCGCCPWTKCPNIRPAFRTVEKLGFKNVRVLSLQRSFQQDWIEKSYPTQVERAHNNH